MIQNTILTVYIVFTGRIGLSKNVIKVKPSAVFDTVIIFLSHSHRCCVCIYIRYREGTVCPIITEISGYVYILSLPVCCSFLNSFLVLILDSKHGNVIILPDMKEVLLCGYIGITGKLHSFAVDEKLCLTDTGSPLVRRTFGVKTVRIKLSDILSGDPIFRKVCLKHLVLCGPVDQLSLF